MNTPLTYTDTFSWTHVVFTYNKAVSKIYINGELSGSQSYTGSIDINNNNLTIGARNSTDRTRDFNGTIDEIHAYNIALTSEEINDYTRQEKSPLKNT